MLIVFHDEYPLRIRPLGTLIVAHRDQKLAMASHVRQELS
jgi:hypothetical protein